MVCSPFLAALVLGSCIGTPFAQRSSIFRVLRIDVVDLVALADVEEM